MQKLFYTSQERSDSRKLKMFEDNAKVEAWNLKNISSVTPKYLRIETAIYLIWIFKDICFVGEHGRGDHFEDLGVDSAITIKWILRK
jgi:hypothetical protein